MMSCSEYFSDSILMISVVMKSSSFWSHYLSSVLTLSFFHTSLVICNHPSASVLTLINWL